MTVSLNFDELLQIHRRAIQRFGGLDGVVNVDSLKSAIAQPLVSFDGRDFYPTLVDKCAVLGFLLIRSHGFVDGNKRTALAAMQIFMELNGFELVPGEWQHDNVFLRSLAAGEVTRDDLADWIRDRLVEEELG